MGLVLLMTLNYAKNVLKITAKKWDLDMITASDYTVSYNISNHEFDEFKKNHDERTDESTAIAYTKHLKEKYEKLVSEQDHVLEEGNNIKIANISFSFANHKIIRLLEKRGHAIIYQDFKEKEKIEDEIEILKNKKFDELVRPNIAYITFETQEGYERAIKIKSGLLHLFEPAVEPTNIIWENSHYTWAHIIWRSTLVISAIVLLCMLSFLIFFYLKIGLANTNQKYMNLNCQSFNKNIYTEDTKLRYAIIDYYNYYNSNTATMMTGALQCFCDQYYTENGMFYTLEHEFSHEDVIIDGKPFSAKLCDTWVTDMLWGQFWNQTVSIITVILNYFLREIIIMMIFKIGFHTETAQTNVIMIFVFAVQFFNTAILITLINANTNEAGLHFGIFNGIYPDFNYNWYSDIGATIIYTMMFNALWPFIEIALTYGTSLIYRLLDKGFSLNKYVTKSKSIQQYIDLYSGPDYLIHFKYSRILNIVFVTFMYGMAMPWLFPIAFITLIIDYVVEKLCIVYYYKDPPSYDEKLSNTAINIMLWAPFLMFTVGFWMFSNRQIFENYVSPSIEAAPLVEKTGHVIFQNITSTPALTLYVMAIVLVIGCSLRRIILLFCRKINLISFVDEEIDENLPNYFDALEYDDSMYLMSLEKHLRTKHGVKTLTDYTLTRIVNATSAEKKIIGIGIYDILANIRYCNKFQYDYYDQVFKMNFEEESTKVKLWLSLGYMKNTDSANPGEYKQIFQKGFTLKQVEEAYEGMMEKSIEKALDKKAYNIFEIINEVEETIQQDSEEIPDVDDFKSEKDESQMALLKDYE
jgi:hypothetical protein